MTDSKGCLTEQYLYAKRINSEVQKLSPVLVRYHSLGVLFADAETENPDFRAAVRMQRKSSEAQGFCGIPEIASIQSESTALVGFFAAENGEKAILIVNYRNLFSAKASQNISVALKDACRVRVYQKGELISDVITQTILLRPDSCDGVFITFEKAQTVTEK